MSGATQQDEQNGAEEAPPEAQTVKVSLMGGDAQTFDYVEGRTVANWLAEAGIEVKGEQSVTLNGDTVGLDTEVEPNSIIVVADKISNG